MAKEINDIIKKLSEIWTSGKPNLIAQPEHLMIRDPIHGMIKLEWYQKYLIDQPFFQRLRGISQLGFTYLIYPGAIHTRFEHSIGVSHLAEKVFTVLNEFDPMLDEYDITLTKSDLIHIKLASLLHDIGHLPMSHSSEIIFNRLHSEREKIDIIKKDLIGNANHNTAPHEILSAWLVSTDYVKEVLNEIEQKLNKELESDKVKINPDDIKSMILGLPTRDIKKYFLSNIIHGEIDVDKIDYLLRDAHHTGVPHGQVDLTYLLSTICLIPDKENDDLLKIGIKRKGLQSVIALLLSRATMYPTVYLHHTSRIAEEMYLRALYHAIIKHNFESLNLLHFNNSQILEYLRTLPGIPNQMIERIMRRDLYKRVNSFRFSSEIIKRNIQNNQFTISLHLETEFLDFKFYNDFSDLIQLENDIANISNVDSDEIIIINLSKIPQISDFNKKYNFYIKEQDESVYSHILDSSFLISAIQMEDFQNWELQICCPEKSKEDVQRYFKKKCPFPILNSKSISIVEF